MAKYLDCNGKYYLVDERKWNTKPVVVGARVIPDTSNPDWTYTYVGSSWPSRTDNAGFPPSASIIYDLKSGIGGDLVIDKDFDVTVGNTPGMKLKFKWQHRVDSGTQSDEVGMALYCNKEPINNANYDAFWTSPGGGALKQGIKIAVIEFRPSNASSPADNATGIAMWISDYFSNQTAKYVGLWAGTCFKINNQTTGGQIYAVEQAPTTPEKGGGGDEGGLPGKPSLDPQGKPTLPNIAIAGAGIKLCSPTSAEVTDFNNFLWSEDFLTNIIKIQQDPMQAVCGLYLTDAPLPLGQRRQIVCGNIDTGVSAVEIPNMFTRVDCGTLNVVEEYGSYLDYSPFSECQLYLPHIGFVDIDVDIVRNNSIHIAYDICTVDGQALCWIEITQNRDPSFTEVYKTYPCTVYSQVPLSAYDVSAKTQSFINTVTTSAINLATKGGSAAAVSAIGGGINTALTKTHVQQSGILSDMAGLMGMKNPCLYLYNTPAFVPEGFAENVGHKIGTWAKLSDLKGFSVVRHPAILFECPAWVEADIKSKLEGGVYYLDTE